MSEQQGYQPGAALLANRYAVVGEIGRGGMGVVWRGEDRVIGRPVAIKELRLPDGVPDQERQLYTERVLREARTAGRLNDPAVITVYDVVQEHGVTYIVMELVEAETLADMQRRSGPLPQQTVAVIGRQVLSALEVAHAAGIVHRDVKPSNIMVAGNGRVKLTDFGIAQALDDPRLTVSGTVVGSPAFMAPERVAEQEVTPAADLWSLGATLFNAVEGYAPFERSTTAATLHAIMNEVPYLTRCQGPLASAIMGMLTANPQGRLSAEQAGGLLDLAAQQTQQVQQPFDPTQQYTPPRPTRVADVGVRGRRPSRGKVVALSIVCVVLLAGGFVGGLFAQRGFAATDDEAMAPAMTYGPGGQVPRFDITQSDACISGGLAKGRRITSDLTIDCDSPHELELYAYTSVFDQSSTSSEPDVTYPGRENLTDYGQSYCGMDFHSSLISQKDKETSLTFTTLVPTEQAWDGKGYDESESSSTTGDPSQRKLFCVVANRHGGQHTGSVQPQGN